MRPFAAIPAGAWQGFYLRRQADRITLNNTHYHVDLVFYHRILRCFVLIDLKLDDLQHYDIGQMNLHLGPHGIDYTPSNPLTLAARARK